MSLRMASHILPAVARLPHIYLLTVDLKLSLDLSCPPPPSPSLPPSLPLPRSISHSLFTLSFYHPLSLTLFHTPSLALCLFLQTQVQSLVQTLSLSLSQQINLNVTATVLSHISAASSQVADWMPVCCKGGSAQATNSLIFSSTEYGSSHHLLHPPHLFSAAPPHSVYLPRLRSCSFPLPLPPPPPSSAITPCPSPLLHATHSLARGRARAYTHKH